MTITTNRRALMLACGAAALAGPVAAQVTNARRFRAGRQMVVADPGQLEGLTDLLQGSLNTPRASTMTVHVPAFRVEVAKQMRKNARTRGFGASQTTTFMFENVDDAAMQAMTQRLYDQFMAGLVVQGYRVASMEETRADPNLSRLFNDRPSPLDGDVDGGKSTFYAPQGMSVNVVTGDTRVPGGLATFGVASDMGATGMAVVRSAMAGSMVVMPRYAVGFAEVEASSDRFLGDLGNTASVSGRGGVRLLPEATRVEVFVPKGANSQFNQDWMALSSSLLLAGADAGPIHDATTAAQKRDAVAGQVIGVLGALAGLGTGAVSQYNTSAVTAGPRLTETTEPYLAAVQAHFLTALRPTA